ncbi:Bax inhibitor-1/YccA family protein [Parascardovia denticolens]|uniref:Bax inhibitor-1/YccA family protein n=1 Tax=Parascardovia denticolens TaxID=78258 RepID=UPI00248EABBC|nr:Bax inhibitor-1/YccA family protein [Parascardovia denticolens]
MTDNFNGQPQYGQYDADGHGDQMGQSQGQGANQQYQGGQQYGNGQYGQQYQPQQQGQQYPANIQYAGQQAYASQQGQQFAQFSSPMNTTAAYAQDERARHTSVTRAYFEMFLGILVAAAIAVLSAINGWFISFYQATGTIGYWGIVIAQLVLVVVLSTNISKMNTTVARLIFYLYAASMGFTLSVVFGVYGLTTIGLAFGLSSLFFLVLTMIGLTTKRNLLAWGPILFAALLTLVVVEILLMIFNAGGATMLISGISIVLFAGFTAYDAQKTRVILGQYQGQPEMIKKVSILCALDLYLDFINFFVSLLQLLGGSSD